MQCPKVTHGKVCGKVVRSQYPKGHIFMQLPGDLAGTEYPGGIPTHHDFDHHGRMKRLVARTILNILAVKGRQVQAVYLVVDEVGQMALGQTVLKGAGSSCFCSGRSGQAISPNQSMPYAVCPFGGDETLNRSLLYTI